MADYQNIISHTKRKETKKLSKENLLKQMRSELPVLNKNQIRRYRLPHHLAVYEELLEKGLYSSAEYLRQLFAYQEDQRNIYGEESLHWTMPILIKSKMQIDKLYHTLENAERAHKAGNYCTECDEFIKLGTEYVIGPSDWWWIGELILTLAVNASSNYDKDGGRRKAFSKFLFGKHFLENVQNLDEAKVLLYAAREISRGKSWTVNRELSLSNTKITVFNATCLLLFKALMTEAKITINWNPAIAINICDLARQMALDVCDQQLEIEAEMYKGLCLMEDDQFGRALECFTKGLAFYNNSKNTKELCDAKICAALACSRLGKYCEALDLLGSLLQYVKTHDMQFYIGQSYRYLGEHYLSKSDPCAAEFLLLRSIQIFEDIEDHASAKEAKMFAAVATAHQMLENYANLIINCDESAVGQQNKKKIILWQNIRRPFWTTSSAEMKQESVDELVQYLEEEISDASILDEESLEEETAVGSTQEEESKEDLTTLSFDAPSSQESIKRKKCLPS